MLFPAWKYPGRIDFQSREKCLLLTRIWGRLERWARLRLPGSIETSAFVEPVQKNYQHLVFVLEDLNSGIL